MVSKIDFSIIIINFNSAQYVVNLLDNLQKVVAGKSAFKNQNLSWEIIILDNNSTDQQKELTLIKKKMKDVSLENCVSKEVLVSVKNLGFAGGNNLAAKKAQGTWLFFLNADTEFMGNVLAEFQDVIEKSALKGDAILALAPQLVLDDKRTKQKYAYGNFPNWRNLITTKLINGKENWISAKTKRVIDGEASIRVDWISGAALLVPRKDFEQIGGFDDKFFMYFEDVDLCKRLKVASPQRNIWVVNTIKVVHFGGKSTADSRKKYQLYFDSQDYYWSKHLGKLNCNLMKLIRYFYKKKRLS